MWKQWYGADEGGGWAVVFNIINDIGQQFNIIYFNNAEIAATLDLDQHPLSCLIHQ